MHDVFGREFKTRLTAPTCYNIISTTHLAQPEEKSE